MTSFRFTALLLCFAGFFFLPPRTFAGSITLSGLKRDQRISDFAVQNLYSQQDGAITGVKLLHVPSGAPVYLLQIDTVPQVYMWIDTPAESDAGLPHALEHLLAGKGTTGRYSTLLTKMRLSHSAAATTRDFNFYEFASGTGLEGFFDQFRAWLKALYKPDFTDLEASTEFYHFGVTADPVSHKRSLVEQGTVYDEEQTALGLWTYYYQLRKRVWGDHSPFGFDPGGVPADMRQVTPRKIRSFHKQHYRLSPRTGFILVVSPKVDVSVFLEQISRELRPYIKAGAEPPAAELQPGKAKYAGNPASGKDPEIYPFPSENDAAPGEVRFAWPPTRTESLLQLDLLQLLVEALGDGQQSLLYKTLVDKSTRRTDFGATAVSAGLWLENSPGLPVVNVGVSGISGSRISVEHIQALRSTLLQKIEEIASFPDNSAELAGFNRVVESYARTAKKRESVWTRNPPLFGYLGQESPWKEEFEYLDLDPSFVRSLTTEPVWRQIFEELSSGKNIWRKVINSAHLLETPYATASAPSTALLQRLEAERQQRIADEMQNLMKRYRTANPQDALSMFEKDQLKNTEEIQRLAAKVPQPAFTEHPPLTPDDDIRYQKMEIGGVSTIACFFEKPPTVDVEFSFDLRRIPEKYYKYLPIFPRLLDSLGLRRGSEVVSYPALIAALREKTYEFTIRNDSDIPSKRAELAIRLSVLRPVELTPALALLQRIMADADINMSNLSRLQDLVAKTRFDDDEYARGNEEWFRNPAAALRYQDDPLLLAVNSQFTRSHWDERLQWLLHEPVSETEIADLDEAAGHAITSFRGMSRRQIEEQLANPGTSPLKKELFAYWKRNLYSFPEGELIAGLQRLATEVEEDLNKGPGETIRELKQLQNAIFNRNTLKITIVLDKASLPEVEQRMLKFLRNIPRKPLAPAMQAPHSPITSALRRRYTSFRGDFPWYVALPYEGALTGGAMFTAAFPGYSALDHPSLVNDLAAKAFSGPGPQSFFMRTWEVGLAYNNGVGSNPGTRLITYYADRSPDVISLIEFVNRLVAQDPPKDPVNIDYILSQTFQPPRSMLTFSQRGYALATDIRDGNPPEKIRRFSTAILKLRKEPGLAGQIASLKLHSICAVLLNPQCTKEQQLQHSIFFFAGPERMLNAAESRFHPSQFLRVWPEDFWFD